MVCEGKRKTSHIILAIVQFFRSLIGRKVLISDQTPPCPTGHNPNPLTQHDHIHFMNVDISKYSDVDFRKGESRALLSVPSATYMVIRGTEQVATEVWIPGKAVTFFLVTFEPQVRTAFPTGI